MGPLLTFHVSLPQVVGVQIQMYLWEDAIRQQVPLAGNIPKHISQGCKYCNHIALSQNVHTFPCGHISQSK